MAGQTSIQAEDLLPVHSRISWGAIFAGAMLALGIYLVLTLLGGAIGLSISDSVRSSTLGTGAAVWAVVTTVVALFAGGWVASQLSVGENKKEAAMYGLIVWGVVFAMFLWLVASGMRGGFNAMVGMSSAGATATQGMSSEDWESAARRAGVSQRQIDDWKRAAQEAPESARKAVDSPENQQAALDRTTHATWWTLLGTVLSMMAAVIGALVGAGPSLRLVRSTDSGLRGPGLPASTAGRM